MMTEGVLTGRRVGVLKALIAGGLLLGGCGPPEENLAECAGNHPLDSIAIWQQRALQLQEWPAGVEVGPHPSRQCLSISTPDSSSLRAALIELRELDIPRDAVVISAREE